ncbi:MAG: FHA domain-containing protein [Anaerolineales bacterium]|nr:FHA domain-containing protein [Anaerolineales bacterium]
MAKIRHGWLIVCLLALVMGGTAVAQEPSPQLFITNTNTSSLPTVELRVYGLDEFGEPLDISGQTIAVSADGNTVPPVVVGTDAVGTFTLFLIDITPGLAEQLTAIEQAVVQFASPPTMAEQLDAIAIYQIGETAALPLLPPDKFHNSVRNLFAGGITPIEGTTALIDSTLTLLDQIGSLKPDAAMATSIVIISDGTDVVSSSSFDDVTRRASEMGVPVHTIWGNNPNLTETNREEGKGHMRTLAANTRALALDLDKASDLPLIWNRIASFRNQTRISFTPAATGGGETTITLALVENPAVQAQTAVTIPTNVPSVTLNIPTDSRTLTLPNVDDPLQLRLGATVTWLDGVERTLTAAQLKVNNTFFDIPTSDLTGFEVEITDLTYGSNTFQLVVLDDQEIRAQSPPIQMLIEEGDTAIPDALQTSALGSGRIFLNIFLFLLVVAVLAGLLLFGWRAGWFRPRRRPQVRIEDGPNVPRQAPPQPARTPAAPRADPAPRPTAHPHAIARLQIVESTTPIATEFPLTAATIRLGRSPANNDIAFEQDITVSRQHAILHLEGVQYRLYDQNSTSGTWVNEQRVPEHGTLLFDGDDVHLGAVHLRFTQP